MLSKFNLNISLFKMLYSIKFAPPEIDEGQNFKNKIINYDDQEFN